MSESLRPVALCNANPQQRTSTPVSVKLPSSSCYEKSSDKPNKVSFLDLPREIRDQIYSHLWDPYCLHTQQHGLSFQVTYGKPRVGYSFQSLPQWLLTNKLILEEGMEEFHFHARCTKVFRLIKPRTCRGHMRGASSKEVAARCHICRHMPLPSLLNVLKLRFFELHQALQLIINSKDDGNGATAAISLAPNFLGYTAEQLVRLLSDNQSSPKHITLSIELPMVLGPRVNWEVYDMFRPGNYPPVTVDLSSLRIGPGFDSVGFTIESPNLTHAPLSQIRACVATYPLVQKELVRVAKALTTSTDGVPHGWKVKEYFIEKRIQHYSLRCNSSDRVTHAWHVQVSRCLVKEPESLNETLEYEGLRYWWCTAGADMDVVCLERRDGITNGTVWDSKIYDASLKGDRPCTLSLMDENF